MCQPFFKLSQLISELSQSTKKCNVLAKFSKLCFFWRVLTPHIKVLGLVSQSNMDISKNYEGGTVGQQAVESLRRG